MWAIHDVLHILFYPVFQHGPRLSLVICHGSICNKDCPFSGLGFITRKESGLSRRPENAKFTRTSDRVQLENPTLIDLRKLKVYSRSIGHDLIVRQTDTAAFYDAPSFLVQLGIKRNFTKFTKVSLGGNDRVFWSIDS